MSDVCPSPIRLSCPELLQHGLSTGKRKIGISGGLAFLFRTTPDALLALLIFIAIMNVANLPLERFFLGQCLNMIAKQSNDCLCCLPFKRLAFWLYFCWQHLVLAMSERYGLGDSLGTSNREV